jgi:beta-lactamase regulating signal transducer with metallopeptidase domain
MSIPIALFDCEVTVRVFAVLAHSLWQAPVLALGTWIMLRRLPAREADLRYGLCLAALMLTVMVSAGTWTLMEESSAGSRSAGVSAAVHGKGGLGVGEESEVRPFSAKPVTASEPSLAGETERAVNWQSAVVMVWLAGVGLMLLRVSLAMRQTIALVVEDASVPQEITGALRSECERLGITRQVAVTLSSRVDVPGVMGVFWPTLVLPLSLSSGLAPCELRAIIVHELVHIRRHDFAVNLVQMLVESLYFFNPAVWWLSRRIRIEREACVDSAVVRITGESLEYATLLDKLGRQLVAGGTSAALVGLGDGAKDGTLLERVKRVVEPGVSPRIRLSWATLLAVLLLSVLGLAAVWQGTSAAVTLAQGLLTDEERVESLSVAREEYGRDDQTIGVGQGTIRGTARTEDGGPLPEGGMLYYQCRRGQSSFLGSAVEIDREFSCQVGSGSVYLMAESNGYAPTYVGPFLVRPDEVIEDVEIVLPVGFAASLRVVDEEGDPLEGVTVDGGLVKRGGRIGRADRPWTTDGDGMVCIDHAAEGTYSLTLRRSGYQPLQKRISFSPEEVAEIPLEAAEPFTGRVVTVDGEPVRDAEIRYFFERRAAGGGVNHGGFGPIVGKTDEEGRFALEELKHGWGYALLIESGQRGVAIMDGVEAGERQVVTVGPKKTLRGEIRGPLENLKVGSDGPCVRVVQSIESAKYLGRRAEFWKDVPVRIEDGVGRFEYSGLVAGEAVVIAGEHRVRSSVSDEEPSSMVSIDLGEPVSSTVARREVILRFLQGAQPVRIEGTVRVNGFSAEVPREIVQKEYSGVDGTISIEVPAPGSVRCDRVNVVGWHFANVFETVEPGGGPLRIDVPVVPAGAIQGHVTFSPGYSSDEASQVSVSTSRQDGKTLRKEGFFVEVGVDGRFFATPIPLGAECSVRVWAGHNVQVSETFTLELGDPLREVNLCLPEAITAVAEVVDPEGRPVSGLSVDLNWRRPEDEGRRWSSDRVTNHAGRIEFRGVNAEVPQYFVRINSRRTWQPTVVPLRVDGRATRVKLKRGERLEVTAIDSASGHPVPGVEIYAHRPYSQVSADGNAPRRFEAEAPTDDFGKAWFSNLPNETVMVGLRSMNGSAMEVHPGKVEHVEVHGEIPDRINLKPRAMTPEIP